MGKAKYNKTLEKNIFKHEGFRDSPYKDTGGTTTIGFGYTKYSLDGKNGRPHGSKYWNADGTSTGKKMSRKEAERIAPLIIQPYIDQANSLLTNENLTEEEHNALVNLIYRNGIGNVKNSGVAEKLNNGDVKGAQEIIKTSPHLRRSGGKVLKEGDSGYNGITKRNDSIADSLNTVGAQEVEITEGDQEGEDFDINAHKIDQEFESWDDVDPEKIGEDEIFTVDGKVYKKDPSMDIYRRYDLETDDFDADQSGDENSQWIAQLKKEKERKAEIEKERKEKEGEIVTEGVHSDEPYQRDGKLYQMVDGVEVEITPEGEMQPVSPGGPGEVVIDGGEKTTGISNDDRPNLIEPLTKENTVPIGPENKNTTSTEEDETTTEEDKINEEVELKKPRLRDYKTSSEYMKARREYYKKLKEQGKDNEKGENQAEPPKKKRKITSSAQKKLDKAVADGVITQEEADNLKGTGLFKTVNNRDVKKLLAKKEKQANKVDMTKVEGSSTYEDPNKKVDERTDEQKVTDAVNAPPRILTPEEIEENKKKGPQVAKLEKKPKVHTASIGQPILDLIKIIHAKIKKLSEDTTIPFSEKQGQMQALQAELDNTGYVGDLNTNGAPEGQGTFVHEDGVTEEGEFKDGKLVNGTLTTSDGRTYTGEFDEDGDLRKGVYKNGDTGYIEEGEFDEDGMHLTKGKITYSDGSTYEGDFKDGNANGGVHTSTNGVVTENYYEGANATEASSTPTRRTEQEIRDDLIKERLEAKHKENADSLSMTMEEYNELAREPYEEDFLEEVTNEVNAERDGVVEERDAIDPKNNKNNYSKNLNNEVIYTDPATGETTIVEGDELERIQPILNSRSTGDVIPGGSYEPFDRGDGNLVDGDLEIVGVNPADGDNPATYDVRTSDGQIITMPAEQMGQEVNSQGDIIQVEEQPTIITTSEETTTPTNNQQVEAGPEAKSDFINTARNALEKASGVAGGLIDVGSGVLDAIGGPGAIVSYLMGKESLKDAMKEVTPKQKANLSSAFMEHFRQTKELQKRGFHPTEARAVQKEIDTAYQVGLEASVRGTAGDRAKYLAQSGILDAKRSSALLDYSVKDAELQRTNQTKYSAMLQFKENFDAQRSESLRAEDMANQKAKQEAASKFTGQMFQNVMGGLSGGGIGSFFQQNSSAITSFFDKLK